MATFRDRLVEIAAEVQPCSVRQVYYIGIGQLYDKGDNSYDRVVELIGELREDGRIPWEWISDHTRLRRQHQQFPDTSSALKWLALRYRRNLWVNQPSRLEVWCESDSIGGVITSTVNNLGVPVLSTRGQASKTFVHTAAEEYDADGRPVTILYVGDWDPSGLCIDRSVHERMQRYCQEDIDIDFRRVAVTPEQIHELDLIRHPANPKDKNYDRYVEACAEIGFPSDQSVEVEAIPPPILRQLLEDLIYEQVTDADAWNLAIEEEQQDLVLLRGIAHGEVA